MAVYNITEQHEITGVTKVIQFDIRMKLLRKCTLANGYGEWYDLMANRYYISPEAERVNRRYWRGMYIDGDYYVYNVDVPFKEHLYELPEWELIEE